VIHIPAPPVAPKRIDFTTVLEGANGPSGDQSVIDTDTGYAMSLAGSSRRRRGVQSLSRTSPR